jgi:hypothetical protein
MYPQQQPQDPVPGFERLLGELHVGDQPAEGGHLGSFRRPVRLSSILEVSLQILTRPSPFGWVYVIWTVAAERAKPP